MDPERYRSNSAHGVVYCYLRRKKVEENNNIEYLRVIVGSHAHGLATPESDVDIRSVYVAPTKSFFTYSANGGLPKVKANSHTENGVDDTSFEIGHFLHLAMKSNPSILEMFRAPNEYSGIKGSQLAHHLRGKALLSLFPYVWSSKGVYNAYRGYASAERSRILEGSVKTGNLGAAWVRSIYNATQLLTTGDFSINVIGTPVEIYARAWKKNESVFGGLLPIAEVTSIGAKFERELDYAYANSPEKLTMIDPVNDFILKIR